jgi:hypothetical protein
LISKINQKNFELFGNSEPIVYQEPMICPKSTCFEGEFFQVISWLYLKYYDDKKSNQNIKFLRMKIKDYGINYPDVMHFNDVRNIRTYLHHCTSSITKSNKLLKMSVAQWFRNCCKKEFPEVENDWQSALSKILDDSIIFFTALHECIDIISRDAFKNNIISEWLNYIFPFSVYDIQQIIGKNAKNLGIHNLNFHDYAVKNYSQWKNELQMFSEIDQIILNNFIKNKLRLEFFK